MPHVDDGTLHALLDGALRAEEPERAAAVGSHLEGCPDCRARLDAAAAVRDRAGHALGLLDADLRPDFQEVLTRAGHDRRALLAGQARRTRAVAWAATVVLALGTGYLVRDRLVGDPPAADPVAMRAMDTQRTEARDYAAPLATEAPPATESSAGTPAPVPEPDSEPPATPAPGSPTAPTTAPARAADMPRVAELEVEPAPVVGTVLRERRLEAPASVAALRAGDTRAMRGVSVRADASVSPLADQADAAGDAWRAVEIEEALALMGGSLYRLPDAAILETQAHGTDEHARVRTRQRLPGGAEVLVTQSMADVRDADRVMARTDAGHPALDAVTPEADAHAPATEVPVRVLRSRYWLTLQGSLPAAALEALAAAADSIPAP